MEIVSADGSITQIKPGQAREVGRSNGLDSSDKTISRRHISLFIPRNDQETVTRFEVLGKNPIYVSKRNKVKILRRFERGEMGNGDMFCVSAKNPVWYSLRRIENGGESVRQNDLESELAGNLGSGLGFKGVEDLLREGVDISDVDPVKEFGFLVIGHEFDSYPKKMIRDIKNWDWFLEKPGKDSGDEDDDEGKKWKQSGLTKRKKGGDNDEEEWTGESEDEKSIIDNSVIAQKGKYSTRSKDRTKPSKDKNKSKSPWRKKSRCVGDEDEEDEDEDDETLGGFIVDEEEEVGDEEEDADEEEFVDDEDE